MLRFNEEKLVNKTVQAKKSVPCEKSNSFLKTIRLHEEVRK